MTEPRRIYISGPITKGDQRQNVANASEVFKELAAMGLAPLCPHWSWFGQEYDGVQLTHEQWMRIDKAWVEKADAILRIPGESDGADQEVAHADDHYVKVLHTMSEVRRWFKI